MENFQLSDAAIEELQDWGKQMNEAFAKFGLACKEYEESMKSNFDLVCNCEGNCCNCRTNYFEVKTTDDVISYSTDVQFRLDEFGNLLITKGDQLVDVFAKGEWRSAVTLD